MIENCNCVAVPYNIIAGQTLIHEYWGKITITVSLLSLKLRCITLVTLVLKSFDTADMMKETTVTYNHSVMMTTILWLIRVDLYDIIIGVALTLEAWTCHVTVAVTSPCGIYMLRRRDNIDKILTKRVLDYQCSVLRLFWPVVIMQSNMIRQRGILNIDKTIRKGTYFLYMNPILGEILHEYDEEISETFTEFLANFVVSRNTQFICWCAIVAKNKRRFMGSRFNINLFK